MKLVSIARRTSQELNSALFALERNMQNYIAHIMNGVDIDDLEWSRRETDELNQTIKRLVNDLEILSAQLEISVLMDNLCASDEEEVQNMISKLYYDIQSGKRAIA